MLTTSTYNSETQPSYTDHENMNFKVNCRFAKLNAVRSQYSNYTAFNP